MSEINALRTHWLKEVEAYDALIKIIEKDGLTDKNNQDNGKPVRLWVALVPKWRAEALQRLTDHPEEP